MSSEGRKIDVKTVEKYLSAMLESFIAYKAERFNVKERQHLRTLEKYYVVDIGLRYFLLGTRSTDVGHILENIVYLELLRRGYEVFVGKIDDLEIDFVTINDRQTVYYQVAATVRDEAVLQRELEPLQKVKDHYQKVILTLDDDPEADYNGIRRINALDWLMGKVD
jgi:predicted AAA+ superfamily ATPase